MILCKFQKKDTAVYTPHLNIMRGFIMAMRRSGIPIAYSEGFNPHPKMFLSPPPPVGLASECEYFAADSIGQPNDFMEKMNRTLQPGIRILKAAYSEQNPNFAAIAAAAEYEVELERPVQFPDLQEVLNRKSYAITYLQKGEPVTKDVRGYIYNCTGSGATYQFTLAYGNRNLRADRLTEYLLEVSGAVGTYYRITKKRMFTVDMRDIDEVCFENGCFRE